MTDFQYATIATLLWHEYGEAMKIWEMANNESPDSSEPDWALMHEDRIVNSHAKKEAAWVLYCDFKGEFRDQINRGLGI